MMRGRDFTLFYGILNRSISICFNMLNVLLAGNLPPFASVRVIVEEQGQYLVIEHSRCSYSFPGGFVRWREHPIQAAQREGKEETGLHLSIGNVLGYYADPRSNFDAINTLTII